MKIALLSDLHLSVASLPFPEVQADVLILAGDIARPARAMEWARAAKIPTLYVAGNHEFYGSDLVTTHERLKELSGAGNIHVLERAERHEKGVRFLGCTLWSDFRFFKSEEQRIEGLQRARNFTRDFSHIKVAPDFDETFSPALSRLLFAQSVAWLEECFSRAHHGPTVVVTHFAPSAKSIDPRFADSLINACFVSDLEDKILQWQPDLWVHGHLHSSFDYRVGKTRIVCNPRGYVKDGIAENPGFDPQLVITVE
ncbi:MAG TPA: metallophosphoesterase [Herbaspirillum sp.]|jgi:Icc-related predicted phosphoesterase